MLVPRKIHFCWFGKSKLPSLAEKCIRSWRKFLPGYEIQIWNEENFDVNISNYTREAYGMKKYAFVSDYARFWILYYYGGVYFDTDVEIIKPIDDVLARGPYLGCETDAGTNFGIGVAAGLGMAAYPRMKIYGNILDYYNNLRFIRKDGTINSITVVKHVTNILKLHGLKEIPGIQNIDDITIYPSEFFCPKDEKGKLNITKNTRTIHHYAASWYSPMQRLKLMLKPFCIRLGLYDFVKGYIKPFNRQ